MMTKLSLISLFLSFVGIMFMCSCSEEPINNYSNKSPSENFKAAREKVIADYTAWLHSSSSGEVDDRGLEPPSMSEGSCNCYYRLHGVTIEYPEQPTGLNESNVQFAVSGEGQNETCNFDSNNGQQCFYFNALYDPFYIPNIPSECALGDTPNDCFDYFDFSGIGVGIFNCDVPLYGSFPVSFLSQWTLPDAFCSNGLLKSATATVSLVCAYNDRVDQTANEGCDDVYTNQASGEAISPPFTLSLDEYTEIVSKIIKLEGCGCDPTIVE